MLGDREQTAKAHETLNVLQNERPWSENF
jgi:hypothetical protein